MFRRALSIAALLLASAARAAEPKAPSPAVAQVAEVALPADHAVRMERGAKLFESHVAELLRKNCWKCHGGEAREGEFDLSTRASLLKGGEGGIAVVPFDAASSRLMRLVRHDEEPTMPEEASRLPDDDLARLAEWIDAGAPYVGESLAPAPTDWTRRQIEPSAREHWAFRPLGAPEVPSIDDRGWMRTAVDAFIAQGWLKAGLESNAPVDRRTLIRRGYLDLTGLPPTPEEVEAFVADPSSDAWERVVDRMLASQSFGERWARHWLDQVRFGESHGFEHDYDRPYAFHYRDFVIRALAGDMPFDQFIHWQIAGDELAPEDPLAWMATGFLAAGVHSTQITKNEVEKHRYDELDDIISTIGSSMLGLSIGCARCHDHKYDPLPQADYYRLLSTFTTTVRSDLDITLNPHEYAEAKARYDAEHAPFLAALAQLEREKLPERARRWSDAWSTARGEFPWKIVDSADIASSGGATFTTQDDGSWLASGTSADHDTFTITIPAPAGATVRAIRIEALADDSLPHRGPGRADNGNFALSSARLTIGAASGESRAVALAAGAATFEQKNLPLAAAFDDKPETAWAVDPQFGRDHAAVLVCTAAPTVAPGEVLKLVLEFRTNTRHAIGRPRVALALEAETPAPRAGSIPLGLAALLEKPAADRSADELARIERWYRALDPEWRELAEAERRHAAGAPRPRQEKMLVSSEGVPALRLHTQGDDFLSDTHYLRRGDVNLKERAAEQGFLQVLCRAPEGDAHWLTSAPAGSRTSHRRAALARWLTDVDCGAGPLVARVIVNRLWQHYFGQGLVATPSDFGLRGEPPSHPELLEWLASELVRGGWRLKPLHRLLVTSAVYRLAPQRDSARNAIDPENRLLWRANRKRLEAETIRDALLAVSGRLDATMFGPGTLDISSCRRSIYFTVKRSQLIPMMQVFDAPDALVGLPQRATTTVAPQALFLMNNPQVRACALALADRMAPRDETPLETAVDWGCRLALGRPASADDLPEMTHFAAEQLRRYLSAGQANPRREALADLAQVLFSLNDFVYVD